MFLEDDSRSPCAIATIIVDDDEAILRVQLRRLEARGVSPIGFTSAKEALATIQIKGTAVLVADREMPEMNGIDLCRAVRELQRVGAIDFVYLVMLTASDSPTQVIEAFDAGVDDVVSKCASAEHLPARLQVAYRLASSHMKLRQSQIEVHKINAEMAVLNHKLDRMANTDALTGVHNRRALMATFAERWAQADFSGQPLSCFMFDIDHFKKCNDTYGHAAGDHVLKHVAKTARLKLRRMDIFGRIGGEEFCAVMPDTTVEEAAMIAEEVRMAIQNLTLEFEGRTIPVSASLGLAQRTVSDSKFETLLARADELLYAAKKNGRNQLWLAGADGTSRRFGATATNTVAAATY